MITLSPQNQFVLPGGQFVFVGSDGVEPYVYSVEADGAGGTIDPDTGVYTAPDASGFDVIVVTDANLDTASATVTVEPLLQLLYPYSAIVPGLSIPFSAIGGVGPYGYEVLPGGAGGSIDPDGRYTAPLNAGIDVLRVTDALLGTSDAIVRVGDPLLLVCDILEQELQLAPGRVYLWDQKIKMPTDEGLFIAVRMLSCRPFASSKQQVEIDGDYGELQSVNMQATLQLDIISRDTSALLRKEELIMALSSNYAESQMERNSFYVAKLPVMGGFVNISEIDGMAIPYRFAVTVQLQYSVRKFKPIPYFDTFQEPEVTADA